MLIGVVVVHMFSRAFSGHLPRTPYMITYTMLTWMVKQICG